MKTRKMERNVTMGETGKLRSWRDGEITERVRSQKMSCDQEE